MRIHDAVIVAQAADVSSSSNAAMPCTWPRRLHDTQHRPTTVRRPLAHSALAGRCTSSSRLSREKRPRSHHRRCLTPRDPSHSETPASIHARHAWNGRGPSAALPSQRPGKLCVSMSRQSRRPRPRSPAKASMDARLGLRVSRLQESPQDSIAIARRLTKPASSNQIVSAMPQRA